MRQIDQDRDRFQAVAQLLAGSPELGGDRLRSLVEAPTGGRRRAEPIRPRSWSDITPAIDAGWVTKNEARKLVGLTQRQGPARKPKEAVT
jgi:hypothetical protein